MALNPLLIIITCLITCQAESIHDTFNEDDTDEALNDYFQELIEGFQLTMPLGIDELNIPVLEPAFIPNRTWSYNNQGTRFTIKLDNVTIRGLSDFEVELLDIRIRRLETHLKLRFPFITADGMYDLKGVAYHVLPLKGNGPWWLQMKQFTLDLRLKGEMRGHKKLNLKMLSLIGDVSEVKMHFSNLLQSGQNLSRVVNGILRSNGRRILNRITTHLRIALEEAIAPYVDMLDASIILEFNGRNSTFSSI